LSTHKNNISVILLTLTLQICPLSQLNVSRDMALALVSRSRHLQLCLGAARRSLCLSAHRSLCLSARLCGQDGSAQDGSAQQAKAYRLAAQRLGLGPEGSRSPFTGKPPQAQPWFQFYSVFTSLGCFMLYFLVFREENDLDAGIYAAQPQVVAYARTTGVTRV